MRPSVETPDLPSHPRGASRLPGIARLLGLVLVALAAGGCAGISERWVEARFRDISYASVYNVVITTVDGEGFAIRNRNPDPGELVSEWVYGTSQRAVP